MVGSVLESLEFLEFGIFKKKQNYGWFRFGIFEFFGILDIPKTRIMVGSVAEVSEVPVELVFPIKMQCRNLDFVFPIKKALIP